MVPTITNAKRRPHRLLTASRYGAVLTVALSLALLRSVHAQYQPPPPPLTTAPCIPTKKDPCTASAPAPKLPPSTVEQFSFPGDHPGSASNGTTKPVVGKPASATQPGSAVHGAPSPVDKFPFPGEPDASPTSSSSSSSSSSSDTDPDNAAEKNHPPLKDVGSSELTRTRRRHLPKVEDLDHREEEDLQVSHYYFTTGDFQASYLRAVDAVKTIPDDPEAHFALAQAAQRLKKNQEAIAEYGTYLKLEPDGDKAKPALKALNQLVSK